MTDKFKFPKLICSTIAAVGILFFTVVGIQTTWTEYVVKDYDKHLTEQVFVDAAVHQNANLVFYKKGCPYCENSKQAIIGVTEKSTYPTFYIDVESEDGQVLVKKYQVEKAATIVKIREGQSETFIYAVKDDKGQISANTETIEEALHD